ncbi:MAG: sigma-70 family RNA polymerase sigma factor [Clostridia bacterium]|nr:sigma-70 family RNA polymerase sigma factor [Clostridia bacterium]
MNKQEFSKRVLALEGRLYRISYGMLQNRQDAMDAAQEAVLRAWEKLESLREARYFETWLTRILINVCRTMLASRRSAVPLESVAEPAAPEGAHPALHDALMALEGELRLPVMLHYMEGYRVREIAQMLEIPEGTVKSRMKRAKLELKRQLGGEAEL